MNKKTLRDKIKAFIKDAFNAVPESRRVRSLKSEKNWCHYLTDNYFYKKYERLFDKHSVEFVGYGASRAVFKIVVDDVPFVFKLCYTLWGIDSSTTRNDNHGEWINYKCTKGCKEAYSMLLPMVDSFVSNIAYRVNVFPFIDMNSLTSQVTGSVTSRDEINMIRDDCIGTLTVDNHNANIGMWRGYLWLIDYNSPELVREADLEDVKRQVKSGLRNKSLKNEFSKIVDLVARPI